MAAVAAAAAVAIRMVLADHRWRRADQQERHQAAAQVAQAVRVPKDIRAALAAQVEALLQLAGTERTAPDFRPAGYAANVRSEAPLVTQSARTATLSMSPTTVRSLAQLAEDACDWLEGATVER